MSDDDVSPPRCRLERSPRGLVVLSDICGVDLSRWSTVAPSTVVRVHSRTGAELRYPAADRSSGLDVERRGALAALSPAVLAAQVLASVQGLAWWGDRQRLGVLARHGDVFALPAADLLATRGALWWGEPFDRGRQILLGPPDEPPDVVALADEQGRLSRSPWRLPQALTTSLGLGVELPAVRLCATEAVHRWVAQGFSVGCWAVDIDSDASVYEVHGAGDWAALCARYPVRGPTPDDYVRWGVEGPISVAPDWTRVRRDWDGVHLSMLGLLQGSGMPLEVDGAGAVLEDVDSELTAWFRPCFGEPELVATVDPSDLP